MEDGFRTGKVPDRQVRMAIQMGIRSSSSERCNWTVEKAVGLGKQADVQRVLELGIRKDPGKPHSRSCFKPGRSVGRARSSFPVLVYGNGIRHGGKWSVVASSEGACASLKPLKGKGI